MIGNPGYRFSDWISAPRFHEDKFRGNDKTGLNMKKILVAVMAAFVAAGAVLWFAGRSGWSARLGMSRPEKKSYVIGVVRTPPTLDIVWESFRAKMRELGYAEEINTVYALTEIGGDYAQTKRKIISLLDAHRLDILYPMGSVPARAAKEALDERGSDMPVVFGIAADPVKSGLVQDLKRSGNNLTGVVTANEIVSSKRLELFLEMNPGIRRIVFPWNDSVTTGIETFRQTARALRVTLAEKQVANVSELDAFLAEFPFAKGDGLFRASDSLVGTRSEAMARLGLAKKIPTSGTNSFDAEIGALMSYGANFRKMGEQGAVLVDKILREGKAPSDLPVELPTDFELVVNLGTAHSLGITVDPAFLAKATRLIQ